MRIGVILLNLSGGGTERSTLRLVDGLLARGHQVDLVLLHPSGVYHKIIPSGIRFFHVAHRLPKVHDARSFLSYAVDAGLSSEGLPVSPWGWRRARWKLRRRWPAGRIASKDAVLGTAVARYLRQARPDMLFAALHEPNIAAICGNLLAGAETPVAISLRNNLALNYSKRDLARARVLYREADAIVSVGRGVADGAAQVLGIDKDRITAIYNPIPVKKVALAASDPVEHPWFADGEIPVVLAVGRPAPQKDHATLVRAFAFLRRSTEAHLVILCDLNNPRHSAAIKETRALIAALGLSEHVTHLGFDENPFRYMARAAVVVSSSRWEGFPNVLPEAMACGTPVASTDAPYGPDEILEGGRWGPLVPVGDAKALAGALAEILSGRRVPAEELQRRAIAFSPEKSVDRYEKLLVSLLKNTHTAAAG